MRIDNRGEAAGNTWSPARSRAADGGRPTGVSDRGRQQTALCARALVRRRTAGGGWDNGTVHWTGHPLLGLARAVGVPVRHASCHYPVPENVSWLPEFIPMRLDVNRYRTAKRESGEHADDKTSQPWNLAPSIARCRRHDASGRFGRWHSLGGPMSVLLLAIGLLLGPDSRWRARTIPGTPALCQCTVPINGVVNAVASRAATSTWAAASRASSASCEQRRALGRQHLVGARTGTGGGGGNAWSMRSPVSGGDVYVGGAFTTPGGISANQVAKWNGTTWSALGPA